MVLKSVLMEEIGCLSENIPEDPAGMPPHPLSLKIFFEDLVPDTGSKSIVKNLHKRTAPLAKKNIVKSDFFSLWSRKRSFCS